MKSFSEKEKAHYRQELLDKGKAIFVRYGIKKTTIESLTKAVGIAKGSFYLFFPSKEDLFFRILTLEVEACRSENLRRIEPCKGDSLLMLRTFLRTIIEMIEGNPVLRIALSEEGQDTMKREAIARDMKGGSPIKTGLDGVISDWLGQGLIIGEDPGVVGNLIRTLFLVISNKERFDEDSFPGTLELLIESIARGLARPEGEPAPENANAS